MAGWYKVNMLARMVFMLQQLSEPPVVAPRMEADAPQGGVKVGLGVKVDVGVKL